MIGKKIKKICKKNNVKFLINDDIKLSKKLDADGCHLGQRDMNIFEARKLIGKKGKLKYTKYFNSTLVAEFIINKTLDINKKNKYLWHRP